MSQLARLCRKLCLFALVSQLVFLKALFGKRPGLKVGHGQDVCVYI